MAPTPTAGERPGSQMSSLYTGADSDEDDDKDDVMQSKGRLSFATPTSMHDEEPDDSGFDPQETR